MTKTVLVPASELVECTNEELLSLIGDPILMTIDNDGEVARVAGTLDFVTLISGGIVVRISNSEPLTVEADDLSAVTFSIYPNGVI